MMEDLTFAFDNLKLSAFSKLSQITGNVHNVTLGPNSTFNSTNSSPPKKHNSSILDSVVDAPYKSVSPVRDAVPIRQLQKELEAKRQDKFEKAIDRRYAKFEAFSKTHNQSQWIIQQQAFIESVRQQEQSIIQAVQSYDTSKQNRDRQLAKYYQEVAQKKIDMEKQLAKTKEKQRLLTELIEKIKRCQTIFCTVYQEIVTTIKTCKSNDELKESIGQDLKSLKSLSEKIEEVTAKCKNVSVTENDLKEAMNAVEQLKLVHNKIETLVNNINSKKLAEEQRQQAEEFKKQQQVQSNNVKRPSIDTTNTNFDKYISPNNLKQYTEIMNFLENHQKSFQDLLNDEQLKQFKFDCKKAVNIPINAISAVNSEHLKDKYIKLYNLLSGKNVIVADHQINASKHPQGIAFCMDLLAKKFVLQGDLMISSNPEAAFAYATIILSLWNDFPNFGKLILGYFYSRCPYLVPFNIPKTAQQSNEEYYISLGYQYANGQIEKQDKFLKRISGIFRLYYAILISKPKRSQGKSPYNIKNGWIFLVSLLKLEPQLDVTATALHIFLESVGFEMENVYGKTFTKLLQLMEHKFLPTLKQLDSGGPVTRLEVLLQNYKKDRHFKRPNGLLPNNFW